MEGGGGGRRGGGEGEIKRKVSIQISARTSICVAACRQDRG